MYSTMLNIIYFINCIGLVIKAGNITNLMNISVIASLSLIFIVVFIRFYKNPQLFG